MAARYFYLGSADERAGKGCPGANDGLYSRTAILVPWMEET